PFERLVEQLNPARSTAHHPLVQVMLLLHNEPAGDGPADHPFAGTAVPLPTGTVKFDLTLNLTEDDAGLSGFLEYASDLFDAGTARLLADRYARLLAAVAADPDRSVSTVDIL